MVERVQLVAPEPTSLRGASWQQEHKAEAVLHLLVSRKQRKGHRVRS